jgi:SAM-dependent methyltransferase
LYRRDYRYERVRWYIITSMDQGKNGRGWRQSVASIPVIGYVAKLVWYGAMLPKHQAEISRQVYTMSSHLTTTTSENRAAIKKAGSQYAKAHEEYKQASQKQASISDQLADLKHQLSLLEKEGVAVKTSGTEKPATKELLVDNHSLDRFYIDFENKFRGTENEIKKRQTVYLPYFKKFKTDYKKYPVLDIGCGRGEMLGVLKSAGINAIGIDLNQTMVERARGLGYKAEQAEALSYLSDKSTGSLSAITGFHLAEHIPFELMIRLFEECYRVLRPGGFIIFETPNPESIHVGSFSFYYDPSHLHPIPPDVMAFTLANRGFDKVEVLRLHPKREIAQGAKAKEDEYIKEIVERFFAPQDYSAIGYKHT